MLTVQLPTVLAVAGTALMAVVIFAPARPPARVTVSYAPPPLPPPEAWEPIVAEDGARVPEPPPSAALWPAALDASAAACDEAARCDLVDALRAVRAGWSRELLVRAAAEDPSAAVRRCAAAALADALG